MSAPPAPEPSPETADATEASNGAAPPRELTAAEQRLKQEVQAEVVRVLKTCYDPEIPVDIYELGLIYGVSVSARDEFTADVTVTMTLTSPMCPAAGSLPGEVKAKVGLVPGVTEAKIDLVWDPPWNQERMSEAAKLQLGFL